MEYDLDCRYDTRKSFYGKARVLEQQFEKDLYSYGTLVAKIIEIPSKIKYICYGKYSQTTTRHQKEFFRQNDLSEKEIKQLFKDGVLEIEK